MDGIVEQPPRPYFVAAFFRYLMLITLTVTFIRTGKGGPARPEFGCSVVWVWAQAMSFPETRHDTTQYR